MLYEILIVAMAVALPVCVIIAYRQGIGDGRTLREDKPLSPIIPMFGGRVQSDERLDKLMQNIDNYDGTEAGQIDV